MKDKRNKIINSFAAGAIVAIVFVVFATIFGELYSPFKNWLKETFNHHWIGKGIISIVIFYAIGFLGYLHTPDSEDKLIKMLKIVFWIALIGVLTIIGFFLYEAFLVTHT